MDQRKQTYREPLPVQIRKIREESFSVFVSNLPLQISEAELEAMFWRVGRILDVFIPTEKRSNSGKSFAFVRFATLGEAEKAVELAEGRSRGRQKDLGQPCSVQFQQNCEQGKGESSKG